MDQIAVRVSMFPLAEDSESGTIECSLCGPLGIVENKLAGKGLGEAHLAIVHGAHGIKSVF